jgi:dienelactone hydrolase
MANPCPGVVVPFYHPDHSSGLDLQTRLRRDGEPLICFGRHLAQQGYLVACSEAFPFNTIPGPVVEGPGFAAWHAGAARLRQRHPHWTGMGKLTHDTRRAIDLLLEQPGVDASRIALMGHSLGGKMSFYAGCLDERVRATVANDFGIGWDFTNWNHPWYLGERVAMVRDRLAHHQLLALHAPRPLLLIAGEADRLESWQYLQAAMQAYAIAGQSEGLGCIAHDSGHEPTPRSLSLAYQWLAEQLEVRPRAWTPPG